MTLNSGRQASDLPVRRIGEAHGESRMPKYAAYEPAAPYFDLVRGALGDLVDGVHFFDIVTDDVPAILTTGAARG